MFSKPGEEDNEHYEKNNNGGIPLLPRFKKWYESSFWF